MDVNTLKRTCELNVSLLGKYSRKLMDGDISVDEYLDVCIRLDRALMTLATTFDNIDDFRSYLEDNYPESMYRILGHESEHYNIAKKHGLKKLTFGIMEAGDADGTHQAMLIEHIGENCRGWSRERILAYIKECLLEVREPSEPDMEIAGYLLDV